MPIQNNFSQPAPKWWRNLEDGLLMLLIPAAVAIIMGWGFKDDAFVTKLTLLINVGLVALVKFIGKLMNSNEVYAQPDTKTVEVSATQTTTVVDTTEPKNQHKMDVIINEVTELPATGNTGEWYHVTGNEYWYYKNGQWHNIVGGRPNDRP